MCDGLTTDQLWNDMRQRPPHEQPPELRPVFAELDACEALERLGIGADAGDAWQQVCRAALTLMEAEYTESAKDLLREACGYWARLD